MSASEEERASFLERWSRRKAEARAADPPERAARPPGPDGVAPPEARTQAAPDKPAGDNQHPEALEELIKSLPRIEDLTAESDYTAFLRKGVPLELQRQALRRAWTLDPAIRDFIEVAECQWDWNVPGGVPGSGELPAGVDLQKLLAQATGRATAPEPAAEGLAESAAERTVPALAEAPEALPSPAQPLRRSEEPARAREPQQQAAEAGATGHEPEAAADPAAAALPEGDALKAPPRRRHGGALPG